MSPIERANDIQHPNYKEFIPPMQIRRMSKIIRMSLACSKSVLSKNELEPQAIICGTGLGCLTDTEKFLDLCGTIEGMLPPTAFIQSTHNTIAGQISLLLQNHSYNMTHTQNALSFEYALLDAKLQLSEGKSFVLAGAADEYNEHLEEYAQKNNVDIPVSSSACFVGLSQEKTSDSLAKIDVEICAKDENFDIGSFDCMLISEMNAASDLENGILSLLPFAGINPTISSVGLHLLIDYLDQNNLQTGVLVNSIKKNTVGIIRVEKCNS